LILNSSVSLLGRYLDANCLPYFQYDLSLAVMSALVSQDIAFYDERQTGIVLSRMTDNVAEACTPYTWRVTHVAKVICQWFSGLFVCLSQSPTLTAWISLAQPLLTSTNYIGRNIVEKMWLERHERVVRPNCSKFWRESPM
jgi:hypothetical protein